MSKGREQETNLNLALLGKLVHAARRFLHHDAGDDEPQDVFEINELTKIFAKILEEHKR